MIINRKSNDKPTNEVKQESLKDLQKKEEEHVFIFVQFWLLKPELAIPDIPENKRVRDYLKSQPLTGHGDAFGKSIRIVQCYRCKVDNCILNMIISVMDIDLETQNVNIQKVVIWIRNNKKELKTIFFKIIIR